VLLRLLPLDQQGLGHSLDREARRAAAQSLDAFMTAITSSGWAAA